MLSGEAERLPASHEQKQSKTRRQGCFCRRRCPGAVLLARLLHSFLLLAASMLRGFFFLFFFFHLLRGNSSGGSWHHKQRCLLRETVFSSPLLEKRFMVTVSPVHLWSECFPLPVGAEHVCVCALAGVLQIHISSAGSPELWFSKCPACLEVLGWNQHQSYVVMHPLFRSIACEALGSRGWWVLEVNASGDPLWTEHVIKGAPSFGNVLSEDWQ